ncbi:MAG: hypothetical protein DI539_07950 [Flavobacterium psychrophilum]|nr:MAG: hypothetical protein DI539_07950 [Flavobacterium psychrophilum]
MKNLYLMVFLLICGFTGFGQNENNHWRIGGLDFDFSTNPNTVSTVSNQVYYTNPSGASISDSFGNFKFKFDDNDCGCGTFPSYQYSVIVPHPGNANKYFVIWTSYSPTIGTRAPKVYSYYHYGILDFSNNVSGEFIEYGDLTDSSGQLVKNEGDFRPLTVAKNAANNGYWVIVQNVYDILSFKIDASGININQPVKTTLSPDIYYGFNAVFRVVPNYASPGGFKMYALQPNIRIYSLDFNNATGQFTNYQVLPGDNFGRYFEISPDNQKLYFVDGSIKVKDLTSLSTPARVLYEFASPTVVSSYFSGIQKDKYGNMLVSSQYSNSDRNKYIHKIEDPNSFLNSSVKLNHIYLNGKTYVQYLPQLVESVPTSCSNENITLSSTENINRTYKVGNSITTNGSFAVNSGISTILKADDVIYLEPSTDINAGAYFIAEIEDCTNDSDRIGFYQDENSQVILPTSDILTMYPNPSTDITTFVLNDDIMKSISVFSLDGRQIFSKDVMTRYYELDVRDYPNGMYIVNVETEKGESLTKKLIKN